MTEDTEVLEEVAEDGAPEEKVIDNNEQSPIETVDYSNVLESISSDLVEMKEFLIEKEIENKELQPTQEEIEEKQNQEKQSEQEIITFREDLLNVLGQTVEKNEEIIEMLEVSPDYSASYEEQQIALDNVFSGVNVLIGLVIGVGVSWAFIKGMVK